jgi:hypothetical protein
MSEMSEKDIVKSLIASIKTIFGVKFPSKMLKEMEKLSPDELREIINENMLKALEMELGQMKGFGSPKKAKKWDDNDPSTWTWQLDAVVPFSSFKYTSHTDEEFKKCWAMTNLRPMSSKVIANRKKG